MFIFSYKFFHLFPETRGHTVINMYDKHKCNLCKQKPFWILLAVVILLHNPSAPKINILTFTAKLKYISESFIINAVDLHLY